MVFYYGAVLWQAVGFSESDALLINVLSGALSIGACLVTVLLIDRIGRKPLLWIGSAGMAVSLALVTWAFASAGRSMPTGKLALSDSMGMLALVAANVYVIFFNMSWGPVMWVMLGEMFPNQIRGSGLAVAGAAQWTLQLRHHRDLPDPARQHRPGRRVRPLHDRRRSSRCSSCSSTCTRPRAGNSNRWKAEHVSVGHKKPAPGAGCRTGR